MYAERNRQIKKLLEAAFGKGKVRVKGHRGTASSWATVSIDYSPRTWEENQELTAKVWQIIRAGKIDVPTYGTPGDMGCDYGWGNCMHVNFNECLDRVAARQAGVSL